MDLMSFSQPAIHRCPDRTAGLLTAMPAVGSDDRRMGSALSRIILSLMVAALAVWPAGCDLIGAPDGVPMQSFANPLEVFGKDTGSLTGQILFPSEYSQRSVLFLVDDEMFVTHPDGRFHVGWLPPGRHILSVRVKGFEPLERPFVLQPDGELRIKPLNLRMARGQVIGRLIYDDGKSATDIRLRLNPMGGITATDNDGIFTFIGVNAGNHSLSVEDTRYYAVARKFKLAPDEHRNLGLIRVARRSRQLTGKLRLDQAPR